jgi:cation diffusion facilitator CzcD-associated flavoprotein CzcO
MSMEPQRYDTVIVGGGQAGLSAAHHLRRRGVECVVLDAGERIGDQWRARWDSLRLFSPAKYDGLDGRPFPAKPWYFPTRDEMADYLEDYARDLPVLSGVRVDGVHADGDGWIVTAGERGFAAANVVLATGTYQKPSTPAFGAATRESGSSTPASGGTRRSSRPAASSSSAPATPARTSRCRPPRPGTPRPSPAAGPGSCRSTSTARPPGW